MAAILDSAIFHKNKLYSFILTQLDDGSDIEFCHFGFSHFAQKKTFTHSFWLNLNMAAILNSASILNSAILDSAILHKKNLHSFILTQLDDGSNLKFCIHLELCHLGFSHFAHKTSLVHSDSIWWWQSSWTLSCWIQTLPSWIQTPCHLLSDSLKNTSSSAWTLTQSNSIWLTWWWQPSWILPCWIQILPSWIQTLCFLLSDSLKNTLTPFWLWLKLIQFDSNSFILT